MAPTHRTIPPTHVHPDDDDSPTEQLDRESIAAIERAAAQPIEVELVTHRGHTALPQNLWALVDIHTENRIYRVNVALQCMEVLDKLTSKRDPKHQMLGARLAGGQMAGPERSAVADPIPLPGMEALFRLPSGKYARPSRVARVVLRVRVSAWKLDRGASWEDITSQFVLG